MSEQPSPPPASADGDTPSSRRNFVSYLTLSGVAAAVACARPAVTTTPAADGTAPAPPAPPPAADPSARPIQIPPTSDDGPWDMSWLERLDRARFKLVFDLGAYLDGSGLYYAKNYLNGMRDGWQLATPDVLPILGVSGNAFPLVFADAVWAKYDYGTQTKTTDPRTGQTATRNVFWHPRQGEPMFEFGVNTLQDRGAQVLLCNNVFRGVIRGAMRRTGQSYPDTRAELIAGMLPGVIVVPAMVAAMAMAQSRGASYVFAGA